MSTINVAMNDCLDLLRFVVNLHQFCIVHFAHQPIYVLVLGSMACDLLILFLLVVLQSQPPFDQLLQNPILL